MSISLPLFTLAIFSVAGFPSCFSIDQQYEECRLPLRCGSSLEISGNITYPFWGDNIGRPNFCGRSEFKLSCDTYENLILEIEGINLRLLSVNLTNKSITVAEESLFEGYCPKLDFTRNDLYTKSPNTETVDLFECSVPPLTSLSTITCSNFTETKTYHVFGPNSPHNCTKAEEIPMLRHVKKVLDQSNLTLGRALEQGFELRYTIRDEMCQLCTKTDGICGSEPGSENFRCLCQDKPHKSSCTDDKGLSTGKIAGIVTASGLVVVFLIVAGLFCLISRRRETPYDSKQHNLKDLIPLKHYSYAQIMKITKSFDRVVGKGGFGTVYKGTLCDGRSVAVKVLKDSTGNEEDFVNEVASMSKTSHVNIVDLLGFCSEGSKRAILYEFLENGSLDRFISRNNSMSLDWTTLFHIALGVARALEYLHHGCKAKIVHFDIKPQNILLDDNLSPKVSDFGLAKLCKNKESIISLLGIRGTIGYIAPEVFSRMYGSVSQKSDVYSYGMLVLEMIGARDKKTSDQNSASNTSSMYFPEWIYKDLEKGYSGRLTENEISSEEEETKKKMTLVGLWCIQSSPSNRPSMNRVVEMMEGNLEDLKLPPRPVLQQFPAMSLSQSRWVSEESSSTSHLIVCPTS